MKNKRLPKRKEAIKDAMVRHEVTWVEPETYLKTNKGRLAMDNDSAIPEVIDSQTTDRTEFIRDSKNKPL